MINISEFCVIIVSERERCTRIIVFELGYTFLADIGSSMGLKSERRQQPRKIVEIDAVLSCEAEEKGRMSYAVHDMSLSGMCLLTKGDELQVGDELCLCLKSTPKSCTRDHVIEATVVHRRNGKAGIRFKSVGILILKDIHQLLRNERTF